jgi:hypothetical protein
MDLRETGWGLCGVIQSAQDRNRCWALVNTVMNLRVLAPRGSRPEDNETAYADLYFRVQHKGTIHRVTSV